MYFNSQPRMQFVYIPSFVTEKKDHPNIRLHLRNSTAVLGTGAEYANIHIQDWGNTVYTKQHLRRLPFTDKPKASPKNLENKIN